MAVGIIVFPGSNCDRDAYRAFKSQDKKDPILIWHKDSVIPSEVEVIVLPGGFSYGDYLRPGAIAAKSNIMKEVVSFAKKGKFVIGICNGFQILTEVGLLPGTLLCNSNLKFISKTACLKVTNNTSACTGIFELGKVIKLPVAHLNGNYFADPRDIKLLEDKGLILFKYCDKDGVVSDETNLNGSLANIAGICNGHKNVFGMMPHPERACEPETGLKDGRYIVEGLIRCTAA